MTRTAVLIAAGCLLAHAAAAQPIRVLIVDGQNNHDWEATTPVLRRALADAGRFSVEVATSSKEGGDMSGFKPEFARYHAVLLNYTGDSWPAETQAALERFVRNGGGLIVYHAADNAFPEWKEYNLMIGLGGFIGRTEAAGPYVRFRGGRTVLEQKPGPGGHHGKRHSYRIVMRDPQHPIAAGLPLVWMHASDELYDSMRGPAQNLSVIATAWSDPAMDGTGEDEPVLFTIAYGKGRVFHTVLGDGGEAVRCAGFITTLERGVEWAATGKVTQAPPKDFPTATEVRVR